MWNKVNNGEEETMSLPNHLQSAWGALDLDGVRNLLQERTSCESVGKNEGMK